MKKGFKGSASLSQLRKMGGGGNQGMKSARKTAPKLNIRELVVSRKREKESREKGLCSDLI